AGGAVVVDGGATCGSGGTDTDGGAGGAVVVDGGATCGSGGTDTDGGAGGAVVVDGDEDGGVGPGVIARAGKLAARAMEPAARLLAVAIATRRPGRIRIGLTLRDDVRRTAHLQQRSGESLESDVR
ncbi:hypothetical protein ACWGJM_42625, partial [Streptomyces sp. NPDC054834]